MFPFDSKPPGFMIAAPRSSSGKTTVTLGLLRALKRRGIIVQPFKCGPDYIDPVFHEAACGRPSYNLDSWAMREETALALLCEANGADFIVAEAAMGLFDGVSSPGSWGNGASADIAALAGLPVVLVLDISGQAQTAAAVARGFAGFRPGIDIAGVILNRTASPRHERLARAGFDQIGMRVFGVIPRRDAIALPERHLGLVQASETGGLDACLDALAGLIEANADIGDLLKAAASSPSPFAEKIGVNVEPDDCGSVRRQKSWLNAPHPVPLPLGEGTVLHALSALFRRPFSHGEKDRMRGVTAGQCADRPAGFGMKGGLTPPAQRIALAGDAAFSFTYPHLLKLWREAGAEILPFSPLADEAPDRSADVVWLPGGYPELHAGRLAANKIFLAGIRSFAATKPVHGECGGYMVLGEGLADAKGERHAMLGLLRLETSFAARKLHLGYRRAELLDDCILGRRGTIVAGHEFHYSAVVAEKGESLFRVLDAEGAELAAGGLRHGNVTGSFFHLIDKWG